MSGASSPKNDKMEENEPLSKKRKTTNKTDSKEPESSAESLLDANSIDDYGEHTPVVPMEASIEQLQNDKSSEPSVERRQSSDITKDERYND